MYLIDFCAVSHSIVMQGKLTAHAETDTFLEMVEKVRFADVLVGSHGTGVPHTARQCLSVREGFASDGCCRRWADDGRVHAARCYGGGDCGVWHAAAHV